MAEATEPELTAEEIASVLDWVRAKAPDGKCFLCGNGGWEVQKFKAGLPSMGGANVFPAVVLLCKNCGNTAVLNTIMMGIDDPQDADRDG